MSTDNKNPEDQAEPWYVKQAKDPTGVKGSGCGGAIIGAIILVVIVAFAWAGTA